MASIALLTVFGPGALTLAPILVVELALQQRAGFVGHLPQPLLQLLLGFVPLRGVVACGLLPAVLPRNRRRLVPIGLRLPGRVAVALLAGSLLSGVIAAPLLRGGLLAGVGGLLGLARAAGRIAAWITWV